MKTVQIIFRVSPTLKRQAARAARRNGVTLNALTLEAVSRFLNAKKRTTRKAVAQ